MENKQDYFNLASVQHPALILILVNVGKSMDLKIKDGGSNLIYARVILTKIITNMVGRSVRQARIIPNYNVGLFAYSDEIIDCFSGIQPINNITDLPEFSTGGRSDPLKGFVYLFRLLQGYVDDIPLDDRRRTPAPMIIHLTNGTGFSDECLYIADQIKRVSLPDGNPLISSIFLGEIPSSLRVRSNWLEKIDFGGDLGSDQANLLLESSSKFPDSYRKNIESREQLPLSCVMFLPAHYVSADGFYHLFPEVVTD